MKKIDVVLYCTENFYKTSINLIKSLNIFHDNLIFYLYEVNFEKTPNIKNVNVVLLNEPRIGSINFKGDINDMYKLDVIRAAFFKSKVILHSLKELKLNEVLYLDSDILPTKNINNLFDHFKNITNYPLIQKGPSEYLISNGRGNPFVNNEFDETKILEYPLMKSLGIPMKNRTHYANASVVLYNSNCIEFLEEYNKINDIGSNITDVKESRYYYPFVDETTINVLLWKYKYNDRLPFLQVNISDINQVKEFFHSNYEKEKVHNVFTVIPSRFDKKNKLFFHGIKNKISVESYNFIRDFYLSNNKNKIVLISTYCDTEEKLDILENNINTIKKLGLDVMVNSPINLPLNIIEKCDYYFLTKDNPVFEWPERAIYVWKKLNIGNVLMTMNTCLPDYGWANMYQIKKLSEIALTFDYDKFYHIIYDTIIDEVVIDAFLSNDKNCNFYPFHEHDVSFHLMVFDKSSLTNFMEHITLKNYLDNHGIVENWLTNLLKSNKFEYTIEKEYVDDKILFNGTKEVHNYSKFEGFRFFIEKDSGNLNNTIKIHFYNNPNNQNIQIKIEDKLTNYIVSNGDVIDLEYNQKNIKPTIVIYNNELSDITDDIINIKHNTITKNIINPKE